MQEELGGGYARGIHMGQFQYIITLEFSLQPLVCSAMAGVSPGVALVLSCRIRFKVLRHK